MAENITARTPGLETTLLPAAEKHDQLARLLSAWRMSRNPLSSLDVHFGLLEEDLGALRRRR